MSALGAVDQPAPLSASVIVVTYQRPEHVRTCLAHVAAQEVAPVETIVVDSSLDDATEAVVTREFPGVVYVRNRRGPGTTATARNLGLAHATGDVVAFLDDDAYADPAWLGQLLAAYGTDVGGVGGRAANGNPGEEEEGIDRIGRLEPDGTLTGFFAARPPRPVDVDHLLGANMSFRREVLVALGGIRDGFPGTCLREETDVALRVRGAGWRLVFTPHAEVVHVAGPYARGRRFDARYAYFAQRNHVVLLARNLGIGSPVLRRYLRVGMGEVARLLAGEPPDGPRTVRRRARALAGRVARSGAAAAGLVTGLEAAMSERVRGGRPQPGSSATPVAATVPPPTAAPAPTVVFVDSFAWASFTHLAALLRRRGLRAVRITTRPPNRIAARWCWDGTIEVGSVEEIDGAAAALAGERVVDLHVAEPLASGIGPGLLGAMTEECRSRFEHRRRLMDKFEVGAMLAAGGLDVPTAVPLPVADLAQVVAELGPRLVVKARVGAGGESVVMVDGLDELRSVVDGLEDPAGWYVERFIEGAAFQVGGFADGDGLRWSIGFRTVETVRHLGPARRLEYLDGPEFERVGRGVASATGLQGLFNAGILRDADGRDWVHDVNPRVWGSLSACVVSGGNVVDLYRAWLAGADAPVARTPAPGRRADALPGAWDDVVADGPRWSAAVRIIRWWFPYWRQLGTACIAYEASTRVRKALDRGA